MAARTDTAATHDSLLNEEKKEFRSSLIAAAMLNNIDTQAGLSTCSRD
jgi:hypothetical protein